MPRDMFFCLGYLVVALCHCVWYFGGGVVVSYNYCGNFPPPLGSTVVISFSSVPRVLGTLYHYRPKNASRKSPP